MAKSNSDLKSIQKKLVAAVAMLMVASIMVVSSSYAWFTLSTAPEVTGITTSVGSNGNLEIALRQTSDTWPTTTGTGNITTSVVEANKFWGNLVDLSDTSYHLGDISLRPARLNIVEDPQNTTVDNNGQVIFQAYKFQGAYLQTPTYGADGRLSGLSADDVINGIYDTQKNGFTFIENDKRLGVRAVGISSSLTPGEAALLAAKKAVSSAIGNVKGEGSLALSTDSVALANIIVDNKMNPGKSYNANDIATIQAAITRVYNIAQVLEDSVKQAVVAVAVSQGHTSVTTADVTIGTEISVANAELVWVKAAEGDDEGWDLTTQRDALIAAYGEIQTGIRVIAERAQDSLDAATTDNTTGLYTYAQISAPLYNLLSMDDFTITERQTGTVYPMQGTDPDTKDGFMEQDLMKMAEIMMDTPTVSIVDGVYANIAKFSGDFSANTSMRVNGTYESITIDRDVAVKITTKCTAPANGYHLVYANNWMGLLSASDSGTTGAASTIITDIYGYALDFAFQTNAAGSSLLLQTAAANRVDSSTATQGAGSYMEFTTLQADFTLEQVRSLMDNIRVVFMNDEGEIYGVAKLDVTLRYVADNPETTEVEKGETVTAAAAASLPFVDLATPATETEDATYYVMELANAELTQNGKAIKAPLELYSYELEDDGSLTIGTKIDAIDAVITDLPQNSPIGVSTLVYLDGDNVTNADVAISGESMTGTLNLQFASSAELDPMDYTYETLGTPTTALQADTGTLVVTPADNTNPTAYDLYVDGVKVASVDATEAKTGIILSKYITTPGAHKVQVTATGKNYADSEKTAEVTYNHYVTLASPDFEVLENTDGTYTVKITAVENAAKYSIQIGDATAVEVEDTQYTTSLTASATVQITVKAVPAASSFYTESAPTAKTFEVPAAAGSEGT